MTPAERRMVESVTGFVFPTDCCLYCGSASPSQWDHFPIPAALGGTEVVRACLHCHNMKDRVSESIAADWLSSQLDACSDIYLSDVEVHFIGGNASIMPRQARHLIDDIRDFPPVIRIMIGRRLREQLYAMHAADRTQQ